jgi:Xaa-Pro aminopeptidase
MDRREFFGATAAATVAGLAAATPAGAAATKPGTVMIDPQYNNGELGKQIPVNKQRAYEVMEEMGIDGLIALRTHNVYYLTNTVTTLTAFTAEYPSFATFPKDPQQPTYLISSTGNTWETSNGERDVPEVITMGGATNWQEYINASPEKMRVEPKSGRGGGFAFKEGADLSDREKAWKQAQEKYFPDAAPGPAWAIVKALKQSGLINGRIAVDDMRVAYLLQSIGIDTVKIADGDNIFRKIRHVKTPYEIELMKVAQKISQDTAVAAANAVVPGMTYADFKQRFFTEATARGGDPGFVLLGVTQGLLPHGEVRVGQSYLLDCSVHFHQYQGDFARTLMIGEPRTENLKRFKAQQAGREAAFEIIKEGVPFRKVEQVARDAMVKSGMPANVPVIGLHSVGLQHGDDPQRFDVPFGVRDELVLKENMTVTLDLPYLEVGQGAGHNEDLLRITKNGYELLNDPKDPLIVV